MRNEILGVTPVDPSAPTDDPALTITFAPFRMELGAGRLLHGTRIVPLRPKTWAVLLYLAERPGMLVSKDALLGALWPGVAVTPDTLNKSIGELRVALGDDSQAPRFIETVHRRGFRFIAETRRSAVGVQPPRGIPPPDVSRDIERAAVHGRPFVGRAEELQILAAALARAQAGERQIVFVTGPAGIGKTALVDAFVESTAARETSTSVWIGRASCFDHHGPLEAYLPVLEALERLTRLPIGGTLLELMRRVAPTWLAQMPWLMGAAEAEGLQRTLQGAGPERMPRELAAAVETFTGDATIVLVLEDLHWSDPSTVDLLSLLAQRREPARLLVIGSYRPAELAVREHALANAVRTLRARHRCAELPLDDLDEVAVRTYLAARFPGSTFPAALAHLIHAHTGGQPLFMVGVVDHMRSRGWILDTEPGWELSTPLEMIELGVPDDVRRFIETQLHSLSPAERGVLEAASVVRNEIAAPIVAAALGREVGGTELLCERLADAQQFLHIAGTLESPTGGVERRYAFIHELHRQVVYEEIPEGRRTRLHQRVGEALEASHGAQATQIAAQLAVHFQRGRVPARALHYLIAAGRRARRLGASREAIGYLEPALALVALQRDAGERHRMELEVRLAIGPALGDIHGFAAELVRMNYERASELCVLVGDGAELFEALYARWYLHALRAERDETVALAAELEELGRRLGTAACGVLADSVLLRTALYDGRFVDLRRHMESLLARQPEPANSAAPVPYGTTPLIAATMHYALALWFLGDTEGAQTTARAGLARARESGDLFALSAALGQAALLHLFARDTAEGDALATQAAALAAEQGFAFWHAFASTLSGWARVQQGDAAEGSKALEQALAVMQGSGTRFFSAYALAFLAEAHLQTGAIAEGLAQVDAGLTLTETTLDRGYAPELWRLKGELLLASATPRGRRRNTGTAKSAATDRARQEAERCLLRALELSRAAQAKSLELRAAMSLARAWRAGGRNGEAHPMLAGICGWFDSSLGSADLVEARELLSELANGR